MERPGTSEEVKGQPVCAERKDAERGIGAGEELLSGQPGVRPADGPVYLYSWGPRGNLPGAMSRKGQRCRVLVRGGMNSALVEFEDGYRAVISRSALRKAR